MPSDQNRHLAEPFSQIFTNEAEAHWAFDFLLQTTKGLGLTGPGDQRLALTITRRGGRPGLHLTFGSWLVAGFRGGGQVELLLLARQIGWDERFASLPFEAKEGSPEVRSYLLPIELLQPLTSDLQAAWDSTLALVAEKFHTWKRAIPWKKHQTELVEALFDRDKRQQLFAEGLAEPELLYERQMTAFYQDVSEEPEVYEVNNNSEEIETPASQTLDIQEQNSINAITIEALTGIEAEFQDKIFEAMKNCNNKERLLVCLYFMSDLPDEDHSYSEIERNLRSIFPSSIGHDKQPTDYEDFQASVIRYQFGGEDRLIRKEQLSINDRLWESPARGCWRNTELGNIEATKILKREGLVVKVVRNKTYEMQDQFNPPYPLSDLAAATGFTETDLARWVRAIERKGQAILYGPPGTGKTFIAEHLARHLIGGGDGFSELVQFHPAYAYEDFMQGIRPRSSGGQLTYELEPGRFLDFCRRATGRETCVLIIDEINRANLARVFGELMYLLEYREQEIRLAGGDTFKIPANVRLIGTMNTADRSIALVDYALRRRFAFLPLAPNYDVLRRYHQTHQTGFPVEGLVKEIKRLNAAMQDEHYFVGITFFLRENLAGEIEDVWRMEIEPYLEEFFFDQPERIADFRWEAIAGKVRPNL